MRKWLILISYCAAGFLNGASWILLVSIPYKAMLYYNINQGELALYGIIASVISIPLAPVSGWLISKSFFYSLHILWLVSVIGCWIRYIAGTNFWISISGQLIIFSGNMLMLSSCSTLAVLWFPKTQALLATTIGSFSSFLGNGFGFVYIVYFDDIANMIFMQALFASFFFVFNLIVLKKCERTEIVLSFKDSFLVASKNKTLSLMILCSGSALAVNFTLLGVFGLLLYNENYSEIQIAWTGFSYLLSGLIGGLIGTLISEGKGSVLFSLKIFLIASILSCFLFSGLVHLATLSLFTAGVLGGFLTGSLPLCIRACIVFMPEVDETISTNMIFLISQILSIGYTYPVLYFKQYTNVNGIWLGGFILMVSYGVLFFIVRNIRENSEERRVMNRVFATSMQGIIPNNLLG